MQQVKKDIVIAIGMILFVTLACFALNAARPDLPLSPSQPFKAATKASAPKAGKVVMHVNGEPVTEDEFNAMAESVPAENRAMLLGSNEGRRLLANEIVKVKALEQEGRRLGIDEEPNVRMQVDMTRSQILAGRTLERLVKGRVESHLASAFQRESAGTIALRHILIAYAGGMVPPRNGNPPPAEQAMQKAKLIAARLRTGGNFAQLAKAESDDQQSAANGGSIGATRREMLPPEIASAVANLQPGQISAPVKTTYGVHIFLVEQPSLEELRPALMRRAQEEAVQEAMVALQKNAKVELDPKFFGAPEKAPPPAAPGATTSNG